jgi:hypothetical protein
MEFVEGSVNSLARRLVGAWGDSMTRYLIAVLAVLVPACLQAQTAYCYPLTADSLHQVFIENIHNYTSDPDSSWTAAGVAMGFPRVDSSAVRLIGVEATCRAAARAFAANVPSQAAVPFSGKVYVFAVGPGHYYVVDPDYRASPNFAFELLFTSSWAVVRRFGH